MFCFSKEIKVYFEHRVLRAPDSPTRLQTVRSTLKYKGNGNVMGGRPSSKEQKILCFQILTKIYREQVYCQKQFQF